MLAQSLPGPGQPLSVAQALVIGSALVAAKTRAAQDAPQWFRDGWDVLDLLAAGMVGGHVQAREETGCTTDTIVKKDLDQLGGSVR